MGLHRMEIKKKKITDGLRRITVADYIKITQRRVKKVIIEGLVQAG